MRPVSRVIPGLGERLADLRGTLAVDASPRNVMRVAEAHWLAGRSDLATSLLEPLVGITPGAIAPRVLLGWCYAEAGRIDESRRALAAARSLDPANPFLEMEEEKPSIPARTQDWDEAPRAPVEPVESAPTHIEHSPEPPSLTSAASEAMTADFVPANFAGAGPSPLDLVLEPASTPPALSSPPAFADAPSNTPPGFSDVPPSLPPSLTPPPLPTSPALEDPLAAERLAEPEAALTPEELRSIPPMELLSATLGEIFEKQGFDEKAIEIYREVVRRHPERQDLLARIGALEARLAGNDTA